MNLNFISKMSYRNILNFKNQNFDFPNFLAYDEKGIIDDSKFGCFETL